MPEMVPMDAMRIITFMILSSCVAELLPSLTSASENASMEPGPDWRLWSMSFMIADSWPRLADMVSVSRLVAMSRFDTTCPNFSRFCTCTPS